MTNRYQNYKKIEDGNPRWISYKDFVRTARNCNFSPVRIKKAFNMPVDNDASLLISKM